MTPKLDDTQVAARGPCEYLQRAMATNGTNGKHGTNGSRTSVTKTSASKPTAAQQRARREYLKMAGHKFDPERIAKIRSQWVG